MNAHNHDNQGQNIARHVRQKNFLNTPKVENVVDTVNNICKWNERNEFPFNFVQDIQITTGDLIIIGVDYRNISRVVLEMREWEIIDVEWINTKLKHACIQTSYDFCFRYGPYTFIVVKRLNK